MARIVWTHRSRDDLAAIRAFIAEQSPASAKRFVQRIILRAGRLANFPLSGSIVAELGRQDIREILVGNYRIVYRAAPLRVEILTVRHAARLFDRSALDES